MKRIAGLFLAIVFAHGLMAGETSIFNDTIKAPRPKVGIVLSGGGAKGAAHIGALKYIEEIGLPVDYIVGTSMGSIIGGLYALGYSPDEIEMMISNLDWSQYMSNSVERRDISSADKQRRSTYIINIPFNHGELLQRFNSMKDEDSEGSSSIISSLPDSFIGGTDLLNLFNSLCIGYQDSIDFNELPIPFACVATDVTTGEAAILRSGKFPEAIRASMAIPGVFSPMTINGQRLVDGGLVNNFPTDVCRDMGADIIIGIEVARGMNHDVGSIKSLPQLASQMMGIMTMGHNQENRKLCNLYLHPPVNDFGMLSFTSEAIDTIVQRGYNYTSGFHDELMTIKRYIDSFEPATKTLHAEKAQFVMNDTIRLEKVTMDNVSFDEFKWLFRKSQLRLGQDMPSNKLQHAVNIFKGTGHFNSIEYQLRPAEHPSDTAFKKSFDLRMNFHPAEPHNLSVGLNYDSEQSAGLIFNLGINQNNFSGLKFNFTGRLGFNTKLKSTVTWAGLSLANFNLSYEFRRAKYNSYLPEQTLAMVFTQHRLQLYISEFHLRDIQTCVGFETEGLYGPFVSLTFDNMNHAYFATKGLKANLEFHERFGNPMGSAVTDVCFNYIDHYSTGRFTFIPQIYSRFVISDNYPYFYRNIIGGEVYGRYYDYQLPFVGINTTTPAEPYAVVARLDLRYRFYQRHYLTAITNVMRNSSDLESLVTIDGDLIDHWGCALKYSYDSPIGPVSFDLHYSDITKTWGSYFSFGYVF